MMLLFLTLKEAVAFTFGIRSVEAGRAVWPPYYGETEGNLESDDDLLAAARYFCEAHNTDRHR
jgi:hypothetical protein